MSRQGQQQPAQATQAAEPRPAVHDSIMALLQNAGVEACEPQVVDMLIDFVYSYSQDVLRDARTHSEAAGRAAGQVHAQDVELAIRSRNFAQPLSLQALKALAEELNSQPLPDVQGRPGLPLPPDGTLLVPNVQYGGGDSDDCDVADGDSPNAMAVDATPAPAELPPGP